MDITFSNKKLEKLANDDRNMLRELGKIWATIFRRRLTQLEDASSMEDVRYQTASIFGQRSAVWK